MGTADFVVLLILAVVIVLAVGYIVKAKKNGQVCIGCPNAAGCGGKCNCAQKEKENS